MPLMPKPRWLKVRAPGGDDYHRLKTTLQQCGLHTVCEKARCPNVGECWRSGTATVMLLGDTCTRGCRFCAVGTGNPRGAVDADEPRRVAAAVARLGLTYVVLTMVTRDDLDDGGAAHVTQTIRWLHELGPDLLVEALVGDFQGQREAVDQIVAARPDVFAHNVEVVRGRTAALRDRRCSFDQSLSVLQRAKQRRPELTTKSSVLVGVGESDEEVLETLAELRGAGVDVVTIGQYLQPSLQHHPVARFVPPEIFDSYRAAALELGFAEVASGPLVRSSYQAAEVFARRRGAARAKG